MPRPAPPRNLRLSASATALMDALFGGQRGTPRGME
jgi:hypothetical protein